jgi:tripartite-type tricarboxylate transporter receptor subunit TctC
MQLPRRGVLQLAAGIAALSSLPRIAAAADDYPSRPVHLIVAFPPGGGADIVARIIGQALSDRFGQSFVIENRPGAGANLAAEMVVRAAPDGYTLLQIISAVATNPWLYKNLSFDFIRDIRPVATTTRSAFVMVVNADFPAKTIPEFIAYGKAHPGKINMGSSGVGITTHIFGQLFMNMTGIAAVHVPYRGGAPAITALMAGDVQVYFSPMPEPLEEIKAGKIRALGVTTTTRSPALPDVPSIGEFVPGYEAAGWQGIGAPKDTPETVVVKLNAATNAALADPAIATRLTDLGISAYASTPAEFAALIASETAKWGKVIRDAGIKAE